MQYKVMTQKEEREYLEYLVQKAETGEHVTSIQKIEDALEKFNQQKTLIENNQYLTDIVKRIPVDTKSFDTSGSYQLFSVSVSKNIYQKEPSQSLSFIFNSKSPKYAFKYIRITYDYNSMEIYPAFMKDGRVNKLYSAWINDETLWTLKHFYDDNPTFFQTIFAAIQVEKLFTDIGKYCQTHYNYNSQIYMPINNISIENNQLGYALFFNPIFTRMKLKYFYWQGENIHLEYAQTSILHENYISSKLEEDRKKVFQTLGIKDTNQKYDNIIYPLSEILKWYDAFSVLNSSTETEKAFQRIK